MPAPSHNDGKLISALRTLWETLVIDGQIVGGLWINKAPESVLYPYAELETEDNTRILNTSDGSIYRWQFTINIFLKRISGQDAEDALSGLVESVDQIAGHRLIVSEKETGEISREDDATFDTDDEETVQAQLKYKVIH